MLRLEYGGRLPGMNEIINANRTVAGRRYFIGAEMKKDIEAELRAVFKAQAGAMKFTEKVNIFIAFFEKDNRRDDDNVTAAQKFILDALTGAGIIPDDSPKYCHVVAERFTTKANSKRRKHAGRVVVLISPERETRFYVSYGKAQGASALIKDAERALAV